MARQKPQKPYSGFPLTAHANGQWCKKIRGVIHFFGVWADPMAALQNYNLQAADLHAGRKPQTSRPSDVPTVRELANAYLAAQEDKATQGLITGSYFNFCLKAVKSLGDFLGKDRRWDDLSAEDFRKYRLHLYKSYGVHMIDRSVTVARSMFRFAYETALISHPIRFGPQFKKPTAKEKRQSRFRRDREHGKRLFEPEDVQKLLTGADEQMKAMILLGLNGGFGNTDAAELPIAAVDLKAAMIEYERPKTAIQRTIPLWPETVAALRTVILGERPEANKPEHEKLVFLTKYGNPWKVEGIRSGQSDVIKGGRKEAVSAEFRKLLQRLNLHRHGVGFYSLRHTFRTWADEIRDQHAIHRIMGHAIPGMSGVYIERISFDRLKHVTDYVRGKLFPVLSPAASTDVNSQSSPSDDLPSSSAEGTEQQAAVTSQTA